MLARNERVRRYDGSVRSNGTAARFDEAEPAATKLNLTARSNEPAGRRRYKFNGKSRPLECRRAFWALLLDQGHYFVMLGHCAGADFCAAEGSAGVCEQADLLDIPALQQSVGEAAHEGVARSGGVHYVHFEGGNFGDFFGRGDKAAVRAESDGDDGRDPF